MNFMFSWQEQYLRSERTSDILFLPLEYKIHIFLPLCKILFVLYIWCTLINHPRQSYIGQCSLHCTCTCTLQTRLFKVSKNVFTAGLMLGLHVYSERFNLLFHNKQNIHNLRYGKGLERGNLAS